MDRGSTITCALVDVSNTLVENKLRMALQRNVNISHISLINYSQQKNRIGTKELATRWNMGLDIAKKTVEVTTQRGIRTVANTILSCRFFTNNRQIRYRWLNTNMFTDDLFSSVKSKWGSTCDQIDCNNLMWKRIHPIQSKSESHHTLSTLFTQYGVPNVVVMGNAMEKWQGISRRNPGMQICIFALLNLSPHVWTKLNWRV